MRYTIKSFVALFVLFISTNSVLADDPSVFQSIEIDHAVLTPGEAGSNSILRVHLRNNSSENLTLLGVTSSYHRRAQIIVSLDGKSYTEIDALPLAKEESLDLSSSHMVIQLMEIIKPIKIGQKIDLSLILVNGEIPFTAHVRKQEKKNAIRS